MSSESIMYGIARYLAWIFLILVVGLAVFLSLMIGQSAREVLLKKQYEFADLLGDNLNHQIYRRFTLPTLVGFGRIALRQPVQYERLDSLVTQAIHGLNVKDLRIYDHSGTVAYTVNKENLGREDLTTPEVRLVFEGSEPIFSLDGDTSTLEAFFSPSLEDGSYILRTTYPLRIEKSLESDEDGSIMGVLEFTQEVSQDMLGVVQLQRSIIAIILASSLLIFLIMIFFLARAEKALAARVQEKEKLLEQLHQNEKLAGMGRVISGIAHEIRNPLGIICSSAQFLLQRNKDTDERSAGILNAIFDESRRLSQTVTDFLDYARPREPKQAPVDIVSVMEQALVFLHPELEKNKIRLIRDYEAEVLSRLRLSGDKDLIYRALYNVLTNASQAVSGKGGGEIAVSIRVADKNRSQELIVSVADNGSGFDEGDLVRFLDPFYTTKPLGTGLGLPIVSSIITTHKGRLELMNRSASGDAVPSGEHGAVVRIILPLTK